MQSELDQLRRALPLPGSWADVDAVADHVVVGGVRVMRTGIAARRSDGVEVTGSAAHTARSPVRRAWLELLERAAILEAGQPEPHPSAERRAARSNGVAVGATWADACERAALELAERDRILRSWWGEIRPTAADPPADLSCLRTHEWEACLLEGPAWKPEAVVAVVIGFPRDPQLPLARGFCAKQTAREALLGAGEEALQGLAFLWNEETVLSPPVPAPTPLFHLDYYLYRPHQSRLRSWVRGAHFGRAAPVEDRDSAAVAFVDLTPPHLRDSLRVARALCATAATLEFGVGPATLPVDRRVHPIP